MLRRPRPLILGAAAAAAFIPLVASVASADDLGTLTISPDPITPNDSGGISLTVYGSAFSPRMGLTLHSPSLDAACTDGNTLSGQAVATDYDGNFNTHAGGSGCVAGDYCVTASEKSSPFQSVTQCFTVLEPNSQPAPPSLTPSTTPATAALPLPRLDSVPDILGSIFGAR